MQFYARQFFLEEKHFPTELAENIRKRNLSYSVYTCVNLITVRNYETDCILCVVYECSLYFLCIVVTNDYYIFIVLRQSIPTITDSVLYTYIYTFIQRCIAFRRLIPKWENTSRIQGSGFIVWKCRKRNSNADF